MARVTDAVRNEAVLSGPPDWLKAEMAGRAITLAIHLANEAGLEVDVVGPLLEAKRRLTAAAQPDRVAG
jgi:hypothetical protein